MTNKFIQLLISEARKTIITVKTRHVYDAARVIAANAFVIGNLTIAGGRAGVRGRVGVVVDLVIGFQSASCMMMK